jgi:hypothetical protein
MAFGFEAIAGLTLKNSTRSVRNSDWSAMPEKVENSDWMPPLAPPMAPASSCSDPQVSSPLTVR